MDDAMVALLAERLDPAVLDEGAARAYLNRYVPVDTERVAVILDRLLDAEPNDLHVEVYLDAIRKQIQGDIT